ncbi:peptidylprolyl isomerase [Erythrobacter sp. LQ02-29]|uniref:peptidylprolyl isomerase n=1 Tax=Erythrobacter sp. LQ02-29 TaxID=2920384 RepID=UPI001F4DF3F9|nr:peptidylprolyl isomerase [Erythrobacter sp. LQ02-29]MCP9222383.1 peptidylprolyl isomerase [Erythrobacter sp. LQ02-29]
MLRGGLALLAALALAAPLDAQETAMSPGEIVAAAPQSDWVAIAPEDLLVMTLAPDGEGQPRQVYIQLMPPPFSQGWIENIRTLARAHWYDGLAVMRVQDNYVVQWGDPNHDNPESSGPQKPLPEGLKVMNQGDYAAPTVDVAMAYNGEEITPENRSTWSDNDWSTNRDPVFHNQRPDIRITQTDWTYAGWHQRDSSAEWIEFFEGWPVGTEGEAEDAPWWPLHCYGMVGVGHGMPPDTGTGGELYTVIGQAPRHLDRNLALVGRVVEGIEHLSSLPRGAGAGGFYADPARRTGIESIRVASDLPPSERPSFEYLSTESDSFARYVEARANRRDPFFVVPAGGAAICNIPVPVRRITG